jgi:hypothetical protein
MYRSPISSGYEYVGRLVTYEQPIIRNSNSPDQDLISFDNLSEPLGVIRINDRHVRESIETKKL